MLTLLSSKELSSPSVVSGQQSLDSGVGPPMLCVDRCVTLQHNDLDTKVHLRASFKYATKLANSAMVSSSLVRESSWNRFVFVEIISATLTVRLVHCFLWMAQRIASFSSWSKPMDATAPQSYMYKLLNIEREFWTDYYLMPPPSYSFVHYISTISNSKQNYHCLYCICVIDLCQNTAHHRIF